MMRENARGVLIVSTLYFLISSSALLSKLPSFDSLLSSVYELCEQGGNDWKTTAADNGLFLEYIEQLSESRSDGVSERGLSEDARGQLMGKQVKKCPHFCFCKALL